MTSLLGANLNFLGGVMGGIKKRKQIIFLFIYSVLCWAWPQDETLSSSMVFHLEWHVLLSLHQTLIAESLTSPIQTKAQFRMYNLKILFSSSVW